MYKKSIILFVLLNSLLSFSQEIVNSIPIKLKGDKDAFQIVNEDKKETILFLSNRKKVTAFILNDKMVISDSVSAERPETKYKDIIGYSGDKSNPVIFWASKDHEEVYSQFYDLQNHKTSGNAINLSLKGEEFLQYFSEGGKFYMLTTVLKSSLLKLYVFEKDKSETVTIDLSELKIVNKDSETEAFSKSLRDGFKAGDNFFSLGMKKAFKLEKIEAESATTLAETSERIKCYTNPKSIIITSDENTNFTQVITIDLQSGKAELQIFPQKEIFGDDVHSNSFLMEGKLFQLILNSGKMFLTVKDLNNNVISEYSAIASEPIDFKNSDIVREKANQGSKRVLESTSQFLRKINDSNCGVSCYKINGTYLLTIGTVDEESRGGGGGGMTPTMGGGTAASGGGGVMFSQSSSYAYFNSTNTTFDSFVNRRMVYLNSMFDLNGKHIKGEVPQLAFDKMRTFIKRFYEIVAQTIYRSDNAYYFGYYDPNKKQYIIRQFTE